MSTPSIRFDVPDGCRLFTLFPRLPAELRHRIWETYLRDPGVNFIKLQVWDLHSSAWGRPMIRSPAAEAAAAAAAAEADAGAGEDLDDVGRVLLRHDCLPRVSIFSRLVSSYPKTPVADDSHHVQLRLRLAVLSATCVESNNLVRRLLARPGVLRLESGLLIALDRTQDLVFLEYYPLELYKRNDTLNVDLFCPSLDLIRRLAVRFCHAWKPEVTAPASWTGGKPFLVDAGNYPTHLYQFLARHLPSLREFYFVDYFIVPKTAEERGDPMCVDYDDDYDDIHRPFRIDTSSHVFSARNRRFHDISDCDPEDCDWKLDGKALKILDWLRDRFVRYASQSHTSRHKAPEDVYFGLLACEWDIPSPYHRRDPPKPRPWPPRERRPAGRNRASRALVRASGPTLLGSTAHGPTPRGPADEGTGASGGPVADAGASLFVFGSGPGNEFKFTFSQPYGGIAMWMGVG